LTRDFVTVALNGDGGDEAFAGYQRYWLDPWANRYVGLPRLITQDLLPRITRSLPDKKDAPVGGSLVNGIKRLATISQIDRRASILRWGSYFSPAWKTRLWREPFKDETESLLIKQFESACASSYLDRTLSADINTYLPGDLLLKADRMTMAHSLEGRSPFLDHVLASWAARLPEREKVGAMVGKCILRKAFANKLPSRIHRRGKQGFGIPVGKWFRDPLYSWAEQILVKEENPCHDWFKIETIQTLLEEHRSCKENHGKRIYALIMLSLWTRGG
jgi:asparagine synthase (glutamine-hydrolysing)